MSLNPALEQKVIQRLIATAAQCGGAAAQLRLSDLSAMTDTILLLIEEQRDQHVADAVTQWETEPGAPIPFDDALEPLWQAAISWTLRIVGHSLGADRWEGGDGTETIEGDVGVEVAHIMVAAGLTDADGEPLDRAAVEALKAAARG